ncbi:MAG TPA: hypothetical protein VJ984_06075 [Xanthomonadales bacterium]|nr:hypothetical protein [Xanthomonadales bacterium]
MLSVLHSKSNQSPRRARGYFLFELVISVVMIAAIVVLAFPTYQDFVPEPGIDGKPLSAESHSEYVESAGPGSSGDSGSAIEMDSESAPAGSQEGLGAANEAESVDQSNEA